MQTRDITLPHKFFPRKYQRPFWDKMLRGCKRAALVWHRRSGKDKNAWNYMITEACTRRKGTYYYFLPTYAQGKKIIWDGMDKRGFRFLDHIPAELIESKNETEMQITLTNGSIIQIVGVDKMDSIMGTNPIGCVFSEYSLQSASGWDFIRPILKENGGWAVFIYTPRGKNHGYKMAKMAKKNKSWYFSLLTVKDTHRDAEDQNGKPFPGEDGRPVMTNRDMEDERREGMAEELIQQEYFCSFEGAMQGSYYGDLIARAYREERICKLPYNPEFPVQTAWDIGVKDFTAIWFFQRNGPWVDFIDYYENSGADVSHYAKIVRDKPYTRTGDFGPHDLKVKDWASGKTRLQVAANYGIYFQVLPKLPFLDGIESARRMLPVARFDAEKCALGIERLSNYRKKKNENELGEYYANEPVKDDNCHGADAFRYSSVAIINPTVEERLVTMETEYDIFG